MEEIGSDEDGRRIEVLFGALAMQAWGLNWTGGASALTGATSQPISSNSKRPFALVRIRVRNHAGFYRDAECLRAGRPRRLAGRLQGSHNVQASS